MADIFEEVEEGLRQDRAARLWKKYGVFAYLAAALLIGGVALHQYLEHRSSQTVEASALEFEAAADALGSQDFQQAASGFEDLAASGARIAPVAANFLAETRIQGSGDQSSAIAALERAANTETPIGKLSLLKAAYLKSGSMSRAETETYLSSLAEEESAFGALALELIASKAADEQDYAYARQAFNELRFLANVPQGVQQRATSALAALPVENADSGAEAAEQGSAPADEIDSETPSTNGEQPE
ncbi:hypothetical protein [Henriciella sp.]|uniref:hypothetical protein n=1 Tax=Henriciella sp. TaxID=1968823 RepID=UPI0026294890|nr:hypothetical protein [Henriciella sp.]